MSSLLFFLVCLSNIWLHFFVLDFVEVIFSFYLTSFILLPEATLEIGTGSLISRTVYTHGILLNLLL